MRQGCPVTLFIMPPTRGIKRWCYQTSVCLTSVWRLSVCLSRTSGLSRQQRGLGRLKLAQVAHVTCDSDTIFKVKRSKVKVTGGGDVTLSESKLMSVVFWGGCPVPLICWEDNTKHRQVHPMVTTSIPLELWISSREEWGIENTLAIKKTWQLSTKAISV